VIASRARAPSTEDRLLAYAPGARALLILGVACGFGAAAAVVAQAYLISVVVAAIFLDGGGLAAVALPLAVLVLLAILRAPLLWGGDALAQRGAGRIKARLRADLTGRLFALGPAYTSRERSGELASVVGNGMDAIDAYVTSFEPARLLAVAVPVFVLLVVFFVDPPTTLVLLFTGPILVLLLATIGSRARSITERRFVELRWLSAFFLDMLQGIATLKMFGRSAEQVDTIRTMSRQYGDTTMEVLRTAFQTSLVLEWGGAVAVALVAVEISLRLISGSIPFDRALAVLIIVPEFFLPLRQLAARYHSGSAGRTVAERVFAILDEPLPAGARPASGPGTTLVAGGTPVHAPRLGPGTDLRLVDVTFAYPGRSEPALSRLDLTIPGGRTLALVGPTGAGKTTVASLLLRFIEPLGGEILVGDVPLSTIDPKAWRSGIAWVAQRPHLFHGTVDDNLRLARPNASDADVRRAAQEAGADAFIGALPAGYATQVGEGGARLSGGQRQRIAIARAFLADAPLVILDEVTSHLDPTSEAQIREAIGRLAQGRTVLIVSHRLRLISAADRVAVLEAGRVVETGVQAELLERDGPYRRLVEAVRSDPDATR
jgi:ATP-binding cassette subfamily C protein CydD